MNFNAFKNLLLILALLSATKASAQVTVTPAKVVVDKTTYACRANTDCRVRVGLANHYKSWTCVGFTKTPYKLGRCELERFVCDDGDSNTLDGFTAAKDPAQACIHTPPTCKLDSECEDGDGCTVDYCSYSGLCVSYERWNCTPCDTDDQCETQVQTQCSYASEMSWTEGCMPDGYCDRVWTETRFCPNGCDDAAFMCVENADVDCQDGNPCTLDTFNATTQKCENVPTNEGLACEDGLKCTYNEFCSDGVCVPGANYGDTTCSDNNPCTVDTCSENPFACSRTQKTCDDANPCTTDSCNGATGDCVFSPNSASCDDGKACTINTQCANGACGGGSTKDCNDQNPCTTDSCDTVTGDCVNVAKDCSDGNLCTLDVCTPATGVCSNPAKCDDKDPTTVDSCSQPTGTCSNIAQPACSPTGKKGTGIRPKIIFTAKGAYDSSSEASLNFTAGVDFYNALTGYFWFWPVTVSGTATEWWKLTDAERLTVCNAVARCLNACGVEAGMELTPKQDTNGDGVFGGAGDDLFRSCACPSGNTLNPAQ